MPLSSMVQNDQFLLRENDNFANQQAANQLRLMQEQRIRENLEYQQRQAEEKQKREDALIAEAQRQFKLQQQRANEAQQMNYMLGGGSTAVPSAAVPTFTMPTTGKRKRKAAGTFTYNPQAFIPTQADENARLMYRYQYDPNSLTPEEKQKLGKVLTSYTAKPFRTIQETDLTDEGRRFLINNGYTAAEVDQMSPEDRMEKYYDLKRGAAAISLTEAALRAADEKNAEINMNNEALRFKLQRQSEEHKLPTADNRSGFQEKITALENAEKALYNRIKNAFATSGLEGFAESLEFDLKNPQRSLAQRMDEKTYLRSGLTPDMVQAWDDLRKARAELDGKGYEQYANAADGANRDWINATARQGAAPAELAELEKRMAPLTKAEYINGKADDALAIVNRYNNAVNDKFIGQLRAEQAPNVAPEEVTTQQIVDKYRRDLDDSHFTLRTRREDINDTSDPRVQKYQRMQKAAKDNDFAAMYNELTPEQQKKLLPGYDPAKQREFNYRYPQYQKDEAERQKAKEYQARQRELEEKAFELKKTMADYNDLTPFQKAIIKARRNIPLNEVEKNELADGLNHNGDTQAAIAEIKGHTQEMIQELFGITPYQDNVYAELAAKEAAGTFRQNKGSSTKGDNEFFTTPELDLARTLLEKHFKGQKVGDHHARNLARLLRKEKGADPDELAKAYASGFVRNEEGGESDIPGVPLSRTKKLQDMLGAQYSKIRSMENGQILIQQIDGFIGSDTTEQYEKEVRRLLGSGDKIGAVKILRQLDREWDDFIANQAEQNEMEITVPSPWRTELYKLETDLIQADLNNMMTKHSNEKGVENYVKLVISGKMSAPEFTEKGFGVKTKYDNDGNLVLDKEVTDFSTGHPYPRPATAQEYKETLLNRHKDNPAAQNDIKVFFEKIWPVIQYAEARKKESNDRRKWANQVYQEWRVGTTKQED